MISGQTSKAFTSLVAVLSFAVTVLAQTPTTRPAGPPGPPVDIAAGQSLLLDMPWPVQRMAVTDPKIADVEAISPSQILILGRKVGTTDLIIWGASGQVEHRRLDVHADVDRLRQELQGLFPRADLQVSQSQDVVIVSGTLTSRAQAAQLRRLLDAADKATGMKYVDMTQVAGGPSTPEFARNALAEQIQADLRALFPDADLQVRQTRDVIVVSGVLRRAEQAEQLQRFLQALESAAQEQRRGVTLPTSGPAPEMMPAPVVRPPGFRFVNMTSIAGVQQVQLQVRVAEVSRTAIRELGINALWTGHHDNSFFGASQVGPDQGGAINPINIGPPAGAIAGNHDAVPFVFNADVNVNPLVTLFFGFPRADLQFFLQALAENQYLRVLAEPTLVALSGEEASFLAGGEFPIPVVQGGTLTGASVTIEYKEFGIRLRFRPTVLGDGTIRLHVAPEVSDLTLQGALEISGFRVPALVTRRAETTLELKSGQTFSMAGLLNDRNQARSSRIPALGDVPVLGALFRSVRYQKDETELMVLVTASLVEPLNLACPPPALGVMDSVPNDWELYGLGLTVGLKPAKLSDSDSEYLKKLGLTDLCGPGAWEDYEQAPAPARPAAPAPPGAAPAAPAAPAGGQEK